MVKSFCTKGNNQSPINIKSKYAKKCNTMCNLSFFYRTSKCNIIRSDNSIILDYDTGSYIMYNNEVFELDKLSFTCPSSHKIDNVDFPGEIQLYHKSSNTGKILIISIFIDINGAFSKSKMFFDLFIDAIPKYKGEQKTITMTDDWNIFNIVPENRAFFMYEGSLLNPPCSENITWIIFDDPINCSEKFYNKIKKISKNTRNIQKLNTRTVYYNDNSANKSNRNYGSSLKCYTQKEIRNTCSKLTGNKDVNKTNSYKILIIIIVVIIIVFTILMILWLIDRGFFTKYTNYLKNLMNKKLINQ